MYNILKSHKQNIFVFFFFSSRRRHTRLQGDWSSDVCSSDLDRSQDVPRREQARQRAHPRDHRLFHRGEGEDRGARRRSEERRVGKECKTRWATNEEKKKKKKKRLNMDEQERLTRNRKQHKQK